MGLIAAQWARELGAARDRHRRHAGEARARAERGLRARAASTATTSRSRVRELSGGGVPVVYDSVGRTTFFQSLDCLRPHGLLVSFGNSSGKVEPFGLHELTKRGSLYVTRPTLYDFIRERGALEAACAELFDLVAARPRQDRGATRPTRCATPRRRIAISRRAGRRAAPS